MSVFENVHVLETVTSIEHLHEPDYVRAEARNGDPTGAGFVSQLLPAVASQIL